MEGSRALADVDVGHARLVAGPHLQAPARLHAHETVVILADQHPRAVGQRPDAVEPAVFTEGVLDTGLELGMEDYAHVESYGRSRQAV